MAETGLPTVKYTLLSLFAAFVASIVIVAGATKWLPPGAAGVDHIVLPIIFFPVVWIVAGLGVYATRRRRRAWSVLGALTGVNLVVIIWGFVSKA
ncbi:MAG: hypothetical protein AAFU79_17975 [Myxococcota bacterium]